MNSVLSVARLGATFLTNAYPVFLFLVLWLLCRGRVKLQLLLSCVCVALIAAFFVPTVFDDLFRAFERLHLVRNLGWNKLAFLYGESTYFESGVLYYALTWLLSFFPDWVMPASITATIYLLMGSLTLRVASHEGLSPTKTSDVLLAVFLMVNLYSAISSWRYLLTLALLAHLLYTDLVLKKRRLFCWVGYVALGYLHMIAFTILALRVLAALFRGKAAWVGAVLIAAWRLLGDLLLRLLRLLPAETMVLEISRRLEAYLHLVESRQLFYHFALLGFLLCMAYWVLSCRADRKRLGMGNERRSLDVYTLFLFALAIGSAGSINLVFRYSHLLMMLLPVYIGEFFTMHSESHGETIYRQELVTILSCVLLAVFYSMKQYQYLT